MFAMGFTEGGGHLSTLSDVDGRSRVARSPWACATQNQGGRTVAVVQ